MAQPSEELQRLALILASDDDARADMIALLQKHRSASRFRELTDDIAYLMTAEKSDP